MDNLNTYQKLNWISFAIEEAKLGNDDNLDQALELIKELKEAANNG